MCWMGALTAGKANLRAARTAKAARGPCRPHRPCRLIFLCRGAARDQPVAHCPRAEWRRPSAGAPRGAPRVPLRPDAAGELILVDDHSDPATAGLLADCAGSVPGARRLL